MASALTIWLSLVLVVVILSSILGAVKRRERLPFVAGVALFIVAHILDTGVEAIGAALALIGVIVMLSSTVPLLRESV